MEYIKIEYSNYNVYIVEKNEEIIKITTDNNEVEGHLNEENPLLMKAKKQLCEYFNKERTTFDLPLNLVGTPFQQQVYKALLSIPYGETRTYKEVAQMIGNPNASRAVGNANNKNPIMIVIPCHRVIGSNHKLVGYAGGLDLKQKLLTLEVI